MRLNCITTLAAWTLSGAATFAAEGSSLAVVGVRVFTGDGSGTLLEGATVLVRDGKISAVGPAADVEVPEGTTVVDGRGRTLLPGLVDLHVHLVASGTRFDRPVPSSPAGHAEQAAACGVTAVLDQNAPDDVIFDLVRAVRSGSLPRAARVFASGAAITAPGGHGTEDGFPGRTLSAPDAAAALLDELAQRGPDVVKVMLDPGGWAGHPPRPVLDEATLTAVIAAAASHGLRVVVHAVRAADMKVALRAGAAAITHAPLVGEVDEELIDLFRESGAALIPALVAYQATFAAGSEEWRQAPLVQRFVDATVLAGFAEAEYVARVVQEEPGRSLARGFPQVVENVRRLHQAGVRILAGTDAGSPGVFHGTALHRELALLVDAGLSPAEAVLAATREAARFLRIDDRAGSIQVGMDADLLLVEGDPTARIADTRRIVWVLRGGRRLADERPAARTDVRPAADASPAWRVLFDFEQDAPQGGFQTGSSGSGTAVLAERLADLGADNPGAFLRLRGTVVTEPPSGGFARVVLSVDGAAGEALDARGFQGVAFRARSTQRQAFRMQVRTRAVRDGDDFGVAFMATPEWRAYRIPFADLTQIGFGKRVRFDAGGVTGIAFCTDVGAEGPFELAVDDVGLFR